MPIHFQEFPLFSAQDANTDYFHVSPLFTGGIIKRLWFCTNLVNVKQIRILCFCFLSKWSERGFSAKRYSLLIAASLVCIVHITLTTRLISDYPALTQLISCFTTDKEKFWKLFPEVKISWSLFVILRFRCYQRGSYARDSALLSGLTRCDASVCTRWHYTASPTLAPCSIYFSLSTNCPLAQVVRIHFTQFKRK